MLEKKNQVKTTIIINIHVCIILTLVIHSLIVPSFSESTLNVSTANHNSVRLVSCLIGSVLLSCFTPDLGSGFCSAPVDTLHDFLPLPLALG